MNNQIHETHIFGTTYKLLCIILFIVNMFLYKGTRRRPQQSNGGGTKSQQLPEGGIKISPDYKRTKGIGSSSGVIFITF